MAELLLACPECRRGVAVHYDEADLAQGRTSLEEHRRCYKCSNDMVDTERDEEGRIAVPEAASGESVTRVRVRKSSAAG